MKLRHFAISQQGNSHVRTGKNCQDCSASADVRNGKLNLDIAVGIIADGVGSCDFSEDGSRIAVTTVLEILTRELPLLDEISETTVIPLLSRSFTEANDRIEAESEERGLPYLMFDTTLTAAVLTEHGACYVGHIGDDGIVALFTDGTRSMITSRIEGVEANSVIPLSSKSSWTFGVTKKPVAALAMMTDGLLDKSVGSARMNNRIYYPFFRPMFENIMETDADTAELRDFWNDYLADQTFRSGYDVTDDLTLVVVQAPELLKRVTPVPFDEEKWNRETREARERTEEALNRSSAAKSAPQQPANAPAEPGEALPAEENVPAQPPVPEDPVPFVPAAVPGNPARPNPTVTPTAGPSAKKSRGLIRMILPAAALAVAVVAVVLILKNKPSDTGEPEGPVMAATQTDLDAAGR